MPRYRWSQLPEHTAWMLEHGGGRPIADVRRDFEERFGTPINQAQVTQFRQAHGMARRHANRSANNYKNAPVGTERVSKGYVIVKVAEFSTVPGAKDNWRAKHVVIWERTRGLKLPRGWNVLFCDHDRMNFDPANLKAVPQELIGVMNGSVRYSDRATLEAAMAQAMVKRAISDVYMRPRRCGVCGKEFTPDNRAGIKYAERHAQKTCRECLNKGLRAKKQYGDAVCPVCGKTFRRFSARGVYCSTECRGKAYWKKKKERMKHDRG